MHLIGKLLLTLLSDLTVVLMPIPIWFYFCEDTMELTFSNEFAITFFMSTYQPWFVFYILSYAYHWRGDL